MIDLVDIFGKSGQTEAPTSDDIWDAQPSCPLTSDPWDTVGELLNSSSHFDIVWFTFIRFMWILNWKPDIYIKSIFSIMHENILFSVYLTLSSCG